MSSPFDFKYMTIYTPLGGYMQNLEYRFFLCIRAQGRNYGYIFKHNMEFKLQSLFKTIRSTSKRMIYIIKSFKFIYVIRMMKNKNKENYGILPLMDFQAFEQYSSISFVVLLNLIILMQVRLQCHMCITHFQDIMAIKR